MTKITNFNKLEIGGDPQVNLWVSRIAEYEHQGTYITFRDFPKRLKGFSKVELRKKQDIIGLFLFFDATELPKWWEDSDLIWKSNYHEDTYDGYNVTEDSNIRWLTSASDNARVLVIRDFEDTLYLCTTCGSIACHHAHAVSRYESMKE